MSLDGEGKERQRKGRREGREKRAHQFPFSTWNEPAKRVQTAD